MKLRATTAALLGAALCLGGAMPASAATDTEVIRGQFIEIVSSADSTQMQHMTPGSTVEWLVSVSADAPEPGVVNLTLSGTGDLPLSVAVLGCDAQWDGAQCPAGSVTLRDQADVTLDGTDEHLVQFDAAYAQHLKLNVSLSSEGGATDGKTQLRVHAAGFGDDVTATPPGDDTLPDTGMHLAGALLLSTGAIIIGIAGAQLLSRTRDAGAKS